MARTDATAVRCPRCGRVSGAEAPGCLACGFGFELAQLAPPNRTEAALDALVQEELAAGFGIDRVLRRSADGAQYLVRDGDGALRWALTVLTLPDGADTALIEGFQLQLQRAASLDHPHITRLLGHGVTDRLVWYLAESVEGWSLDEVLEQGGRIPPEHALRLLAQVGSALDYAHRRGVVHGSLNPSNLLIDRAGWVRVTDFGVRQALAPLAAARGNWSLLGPPVYLAPEQQVLRAGAAGASVDQYALGVLAYHCLTGQLPQWRRPRGKPGVGDAAAMLFSIHARCPGLSPHIDGVVGRALRPNPLERFPTVLEFVAALDGCAVVDASMTPRPQEELRDWNLKVLLPDPPPAAAPLPRRRIAAFAVPVLVLLVGSLFLARRVEAPGSAEAGLPEVMLDARPSAELVPPLDAGAPLPAPRALEPELPPERPVALTAPSTRPAATRPLSAPRTPASSTLPLRAEASPARTPAVVTRTPVLIAPRTVTPAEQPAPPELGSLWVNSRPWGEVYVDGRKVGNTPLMNLALAPGVYRLRVVHDGFEPHEQIVQIQPGQAVRLTGIVLKEIVP